MANDSWRTPPEVFNKLNLEFEFVADMAATTENALCKLFFTEEDDSLSMNWANEMEYMHDLPDGNKYVWLNCPYSNPMPWIKKALEAQLCGLGVVMLLNSDKSVGWFSESLKGVSEIRDIIGEEKESGTGYHSGRLAFLDESGEPARGNNKAQFILVFNPFKIAAQVTTYVKRSSFYQ